jgi:hypothetical protein
LALQAFSPKQGFSGWALWALTLGVMLLRRAPAALPQMA